MKLLDLFRKLPGPSDETRQANAENHELRGALAHSIIQFERQRSTVAEVADNVMAYMNKGGSR